MKRLNGASASTSGSVLGEAPRVGDQVPVPREADQALHRRRIERAGLQHLVRRRRVVDHAELRGVPRDRRAAQPLQDADLDLVRLQRDQPVEAGGERRQVLARQAGDQVDVQVRLRVRAQPAEVGFGGGVVLAPGDPALHGDVEGLDADLELQRAGRKARDRRLQRLGQVIRDQFEVQERRVVGTRRDQPEEELEDAHRGRHLEVERAVDELEVARAALVQARQFGQQRLERKGPRGPVERGQAELALERAAARGLDVDRPVRQVRVGVLAVRQRQAFQRRLLAGVHPVQRPRAVQQGRGQPRERHVAPSGDHVVGEPADLLRLDFVADFRPADDHDDARRARLQLPDHLRGLQRRSRCRRRSRRCGAAPPAARRRSPAPASAPRTPGSRCRRAARRGSRAGSASPSAACE